MANVTFKKGLSLLLLAFLLTFDSFSQGKNRLTKFSSEFPVFLSELDDFMTASDNDVSKSIYKLFSKESKNLSSFEKEKIIDISNVMLSKKFRSKPHFQEFLSAISSLNKSTNGDILLIEWLDVMTKFIDFSASKRFTLFCVFTNNLVKNNIIRDSKSAKWSFSNTNYHFKVIDYEPIIAFDSNFDLTCSSDKGSYTIFSTKGEYNFETSKWFGTKGVINWEAYALAKDSVFAEIDTYMLDARKSDIIADSVVFYNLYDYPKAIKGQLINKIIIGKQTKLFPKFTSYSKEIELKEIFTDIDYRGGYKMHGKDFVADGGNYAEAKIVFKRNGEELFVANANKFIITNDKIVSNEAGVKIFFDNDSIYHGNLQFKYLNIDRSLQLYRKVNGFSGAPMLNTYHNVTIDFELLKWNIDSDIITFGSLPGSAESRVEVESVDRYLKSKFQSMAGIDAIHPLLLINNYVEEYREKSFYVDDFARFAKFPRLQMQHYLIQLANDGFIFYDFGLERVNVLPKLFNYIDAASDLGDYDVLSFNSVITPGQYNTNDKYLVNAALNIETKDLNIIGVKNVEVSQNRGVYIYPRNGLIILKKNRDFMFNGQVYAGKGRVNLFGRDFLFNYDEFKLDLNNIDSMQLSVPIQPVVEDMYGDPLLTPIRTVIEAVKGDLRIDDPTNKSGIRRDSFPEFPIFRSFDHSYAYYDDKSLYNGVYNRSNFYFHIDPFEIDSVDNYTGKGLGFSGTFESADIFPTFFDTLKLQEDYSLGFKRKTPSDGFDIYKGKARYYDDIDLSHKGLRGNGKFEYLSSNSTSDSISFFPDSTNLHSQTFVIREIPNGIEFPSVKNTETYMHFEPYQDRLDILKKSDVFEFYNLQANFDGDLLMRPAGLTGGGIMSLERAEVNSKLFSFNANWFGSDTASLKVFEVGGGLAFKANDLNTYIDLFSRNGIFYSNGSQSYVELPANQYITFIDKLKWKMDEESLTLGDTIVNGSGSEFISVHPLQDSISFFASTAFYSLKDYIIHANGVKNIDIADASILPDSGVVTVAKNAKIETLYSSQIITDRLTKYHLFHNSTVDINTAHNFTASGDYTYIDALNNEQKIFFNRINVNEDTITIAKGNVTDANIFHINSKFDFKGDVDLISEQKDLIFDGYFLINHECDLLEKDWIKFKSKVNPKNIVFALEDKVYNDQNDLLSTGLVMSFDSTNFYSTFLSRKKRTALDVSILSASNSLRFSKNKSAYVIGGPDSLSNYFLLNDNNCTTYGEGFLDLDLNLGQVNSVFVGSASSDMATNKTEMEGFFMLDFFLSKKAMDIMAEDLYGAPGDEFIEYDNSFTKNLSRIVGKEKGEELILDLELKDEYSRFPQELEHSLVFSSLKFNWDNTNKAFVAKGSIAIHSIFDKVVNSTVDGYVIIEKGQNSDVMTIYMQTELYDEYYFYYKNGVMQAWSTNPYFTEAINEIKDDKRVADRVKGVQSYRYMTGADDVTEKFLKNVKKKY